MASGDNIGGKAVDKFFSSWSQHPLSLFVLTVLITFSFIFLLLHDGVGIDGQATIIATYLFSIGVIGIVSSLLLIKKQVLYNSLAVLNSQLDERIDHLCESLEKIKLDWVQEPYVEDAEWLCPSSAKDPITDEMRQVVRNFEFLHHIEQDCGVDKPIEDKVYLKLAKFYYKEEEFQKALNYVNKIQAPASPEISNHHRDPERVLAAELSLCKGQILRKLARPEEATREFEIAKTVYPFAKCLICMMKTGSTDITKIDSFLKETEKCPNSRLTEFCINKISTAYYKKGKVGGWHSTEGKANIRMALSMVEEAIQKFDSGTAYYNKACNLSIMAEFDIQPYEDRQLDKTEFRDRILNSLKEAFVQRPVLVVQSRNEQDLRWIKQKYLDDFYKVVGKVYDNDYMFLK